MAVMMILSLLSTTVLAAQPTAYRDPAEHWMSAGNRTSELDVNAVTTKASFVGKVKGVNIVDGSPKIVAESNGQTYQVEISEVRQVGEADA